MALKGPYNCFGSNKIVAQTGYAVVDQIMIGKDGAALCHVSIYADAPEVSEVEQEKTVANEVIKEMVEVKNRGPVIEHFNVGGINTTGKDAFVACYEQLKEQGDGRFDQMVDA